MQYLLSGGDGFVKSKDPELQVFLDIYFNGNESFAAELYDVLTGTVVGGFCYMYAYKNEDGLLSFQCADAQNVTEADGRCTSDGRHYYIYHYTEREYPSGDKIHRIQVMDDEQTYYFVQKNDALPEKDPERKQNPEPHAIYHRDNDDTTYFEGLGFAPFFRLDNNKDRISGLKPVKRLIDDYDLMACGLSNNLQDFTEGIYVDKGYGGDDLDKLQHNLKTKKVVSVDPEGDVDIRTINIPVEARRTKLELDEKNIYRFGMGFNAAQLGDGNITNVVIKSRYALLDLKCNKLEIRLRQFLRKIVKVVLEEINREHGTDYQQKDVYFEFKREVMTNASDNAQIEKTEAETRRLRINTLLDLMAQAPTEQLRKDLCAVMDWNYEELQSQFPENPEAETQAALQLLAEVNPDE